MEQHRLASGGGKAMGKLGGEDAEFYAGILKELHRKGRLDDKGVQYDPYTSPRTEGDVLGLVVDGQAVQSAAFGDAVEVILPRTGFYIESGGQVADEGIIRSLALSNSGEPEWQIEVRDMRRPSAGVIVHVGEVIAGQPRVGDQAVAEVDLPRRHDIMRNHTATHLMHSALHTVLGEHARQAGSLVAPDRLRFDFNHPEAMTKAQLERVERIVNEAVAADMEVMPKLRSREDAIAEGAMALFGEKYGETVRTISILGTAPGGKVQDSSVHPTAMSEHAHRYSYELCGGTHLERTSDVGVFLIVSEGSAAAGVRRIEAVTGRGSYELIRRRFAALEDTADTLRTSLDEVPGKVATLQNELARGKRDLAELRKQQAVLTFEAGLQSVRVLDGSSVLALEVPNADVDTLRALGDQFRAKYPLKAAAVLASGPVLLAVITEDLVKRGLKAADLIAAVGGRGGGRPNIAQGSLPSGQNLAGALEKLEPVVLGKIN
jgi:alanyl-tRNA synthetase